MYTAVPLTQNLPKTEEEKIMKYENLAVEIKNIWKLNVIICLLVILVEGTVTKNFLKHSQPPIQQTLKYNWLQHGCLHLVPV
jgi:hypothetical protein